MALDQTPTYQSLIELARGFEQKTILSLFQTNSERFEQYSLQAPHIFLDYSKNKLDDTTLASLVALANDAGLAEKMIALKSGEHVNNTEDRPALHTALRTPYSESPPEIGNAVEEAHIKMSSLIELIDSGKFTGYTGKPIRTLVSIGIGGSFLGPKMVTEALKPYAKEGFRCLYVANIDGSDIHDTLAQVDAETTLFLLQSKSFTTLETLENTKVAISWLEEAGLNKTQISQQFVAVTANKDAAIDFGISEDRILPMWDWVGGRYSLWSAIGFPIAFLLGMENFKQLLQGAHDIDTHFFEAPYTENLPVLLALIGFWYSNMMGAESCAVIPYDHHLHYLPDHLQQLDMESNGKSVDKQGNPVNYQTGPIIWGGEGSNGQHAYHQLLHQGTKLIPVDFIFPVQCHHPYKSHHSHLLSNCLSQSQALMQGKSYEQAYEELIAKGIPEAQAAQLSKHKTIAGNKPSNTLVLSKMDPASVGALIATYEHKVFVQGVLWNVNSFDQWGVELGKELGKKVFEALNQENDSTGSFDGSTSGLINLVRKG